jgi:hypothetical protein
VALRAACAGRLRLHERDRDAVKRSDDTRDQTALDGGLGLGGFESVVAGMSNRGVDIAAHQCNPPASRTRPHRTDDLDHGPLELEECLARTAAGFADTLALDADFFLRGDRIFQHRRHHDDVLEIFDRVRIRSARGAEPRGAPRNRLVDFDRRGPYVGQAGAQHRRLYRVSAQRR